MLRATHDAILVGTGTVLADDPELTCRLPGLSERSPVRVVLDRKLRVPLTSQLIARVEAGRTWFVTHPDADAAHVRELGVLGVTVITVLLDGSGRLSLPQVLRSLGDLGIRRLLVEGGSTVAASLFEENLVDRVYWFRSAAVIGGDGLPAAAALGVDRLADARLFVRVDTETVGADVLETYRRFA
jgi:diaminohydroxyphosphoribosylaminopyrimidine deaminase/5-amino-6-(5-phosphoribosylamino)uracil reductase